MQLAGSVQGAGFVERSPHWASVLEAFHRYEVLGRLGSGGMAEIFLVREKDGQRRNVVLKRLFPVLADEEELKAMFVDEARLGMRLTHPNLCRVYDVGELEGQLCIAMEHVEGAALADLLDRSPNGLPIPVALSIIADVAGALYSVHTARDERGRPLGIVHRDVSPRNVMVGWDGQAKLLDFGVAKSALNEAITRPGMAKGKFAYLAPELWSEAKPDARADIFSLGVCLFEALTGTRLYHRSAPLDSKNAIVDAPVPSLREYLPKVPEALDRIVRRSMAKKPEDRFESAGAFQTALVELMEALETRPDFEVVAAIVCERFADERWRGPKLEPTTFGQSVSTRPPPPEVTEASSSGPNPALAPPSVPPVGRRSMTPWLLAGGAALGAIVGIVTVISTGSPSSSALSKIVEPPSFAAAARIEMPVRAPSAPQVAPIPEPEPPRVVAIDDVVFEPAPPVADGLLSVNTRPWSEVFVDGRSIGMTPLAEVPVPVGRHALTFVDPEGNSHHRTVEVPTEGPATVFHDLRAEDDAPIAELAPGSL